MNKEVEVFMPCRERIDDGVSLGDCAPVFVGHEKISMLPKLTDTDLICPDCKERERLGGWLKADFR